MVTNQSGISRGFYSWQQYEMVTEKMVNELAKIDALPTAIYANGYGPSDGEKSWRKPNPGMLFEASKDLGINLRESTIIGDRLSDLEAGANAGITKLVHVLTGHGIKERAQVEKTVLKDQLFCDKILKMVKNLEELSEDAMFLR